MSNSDAANEEQEQVDDSSISAKLSIFLASSGFDDKLYEFLQDEVSGLSIAEDGEEQVTWIYSC